MTVRGKAANAKFNPIGLKPTVYQTQQLAV